MFQIINSLTVKRTVNDKVHRVQTPARRVRLLKLTLPVVTVYFENVSRSLPV